MEQNAANFISLFNEIDKYLDKLLQTEKFLPYNEKLKQVVEWDYSIAHYVKKNQAKLKYFGELRNHIAHGQQLQGQYYSVPTYRAVDELRKAKEQILSPIPAISLFKKEVHSCKTSDLLQNVLIEMKNHSNSHIPVYDSTDIFVGVLTESTLSNWLSSQWAKWPVNMNTIHVGDLDLTQSNDSYLFIPANKSIYEVESLFEKQVMWEKPLGVAFITEKGTSREKIEGIVTVLDLPKIAKYDFIV